MIADRQHPQSIAAGSHEVYDFQSTMNGMHWVGWTDKHSNNGSQESHCVAQENGIWKRGSKSGWRNAMPH